MRSPYRVLYRYHLLCWSNRNEELRKLEVQVEVRDILVFSWEVYLSPEQSEARITSHIVMSKEWCVSDQLRMCTSSVTASGILAAVISCM